MATQNTIFRSIEIVEDLELTLDRTIPDNVMPYMQPVGPGGTRLMVDPSVVKNAQSIIVNLLTASGPIQSMEFTYAPSANYQDLVDRYSESQALGTPTSSGPGQTTTWQDAQTRFTLTAKGSGSGSLVTSTLQDA